MLPWHMHHMRSEIIFSSLSRWQRSQRHIRGVWKKRKSRYAGHLSLKSAWVCLCWVFSFRVGLSRVLQNVEAHRQTSEWVKQAGIVWKVLFSKVRLVTWVMVMLHSIGRNYTNEWAMVDNIKLNASAGKEKFNTENWKVSEYRKEWTPLTVFS